MKATCKTLYVAAEEAVVKTAEIPVAEEAAPPDHVENSVVNLYPQIPFQTIDGFGGAMTESTAWLLSKMPADTRRELMDYFFGADGLNMRFIRVHMDSCDYSLSEYQAVEDPIADPELQTFSLKRDQEYILPMLKEALAAGHDIRVLLSPWSPPACWKTPPTRKGGNGAIYGFMEDDVSEEPSRCNGGSLKPEYYASWAKYMVKFVCAYLEEGIPVTMLSVQNEETAATNWDSCVWSAEEERVFIRDFLYPEMKKAGISDKVGLYIWDHNKERAVERAQTAFSDKDVRDAVQGIAFHWYSGDHFEAVELLSRLYPEKVLLSSECCEMNLVGFKRSPMASMMGLDKCSDSTLELREAVHYAHDIIGNLNAGMQRWIDWNLVLDASGGPRHVKGSGFAATVIANPDGTYRKKMSAAYVALIAKSIQPGAVRIGFSRYCDDFDMTAVKNPDGSVCAIFLNSDENDTLANIRIDGQLLSLPLPAHTISAVSLN
ncbi:MAG: glycoside hydrolase [Lachnospiraceae bacterium]|nr:glycoside hydrolase [Lachnospiraceae bacterium]